MASCRFAFLCQSAAEGMNGLYSALNLGVRYLEPSQLPASLIVGLVAEIDWTPDEYDDNHALRITMRHVESDDVVYQQTLVAAIRHPEKPQTRNFLSATVFVILPFDAHRPGEYAIDVASDGAILTSVPLIVDPNFPSL